MMLAYSNRFRRRWQDFPGIQTRGGLEVSLLGSYGEDALRDELETALRRWSMLEAHRGAVVELE